MTSVIAILSLVYLCDLIFSSNTSYNVFLYFTFLQCWSSKPGPLAGGSSSNPSSTPPSNDSGAYTDEARGVDDYTAQHVARSSSSSSPLLVQDPNSVRSANSAASRRTWQRDRFSTTCPAGGTTTANSSHLPHDSACVLSSTAFELLPSSPAHQHSENDEALTSLRMSQSVDPQVSHVAADPLQPLLSAGHEDELMNFSSSDASDYVVRRDAFNVCPESRR